MESLIIWERPGAHELGGVARAIRSAAAWRAVLASAAELAARVAQRLYGPRDGVRPPPGYWGRKRERASHGW